VQSAQLVNSFKRGGDLLQIQMDDQQQNHVQMTEKKCQFDIVIQKVELQVPSPIYIYIQVVALNSKGEPTN
jgi:lipopolysaccharide/colanic/teichoic acid biosynthesis glycosyltransferase